MGTTRLGIFPSLNNKVMYDKLDKGLAEWFLARFPNDFFSHVFIENQSNNSNNYKLNPNGELIPINSSQVKANECENTFPTCSVTLKLAELIK